MKKRFLNKWIFVGIIFLFIGINIVQSSSIPLSKLPIISSKNTLYVGGIGTNNFSKIQNAIENASDGFTVFVYDDSSPYYENLEISKSIILLGENKNSTIIDGSGKKEVIFLSANNIVIKDFSIMNSSANSSGILIYKYANYVEISKNIIKDNCRGIFLYNPGYHMIYPFGKNLGPNENYIENNFILNNTMGISLYGSNNNKIRRNWIENNNYGISISRGDYPTAPPSYGNRITKNVFIGNNKSAFDECNNRWISNYWDDWIGLKYKIFRFLPYRIPGSFRFLSNLDWFPAKNPIEIV